MEPAVASVTIGGPYSAKGLSETPSRARIFVCRPAKCAAKRQPCAKQILSTLMRRAYRRPVTDADVQDVMSFYESGRSEGSFEDGIETAMQRILVDPEFLFRVERDPPQAAPGAAYRISDLELASRLSFFLWSSIPDDELLNLAEKRQAERSRDARSGKCSGCSPMSVPSALVKNFAGQWLYLRNLQKILPNPDFFPEFDANLRNSFETGERAVLPEHHLGRPERARSASARTTRSSTSAWRATTGSRTSTAAISGASR